MQLAEIDKGISVTIKARENGTYQVDLHISGTDIKQQRFFALSGTSRLDSRRVGTEQGIQDFTELFPDSDKARESYGLTENAGKLDHLLGYLPPELSPSLKQQQKEWLRKPESNDVMVFMMRHGRGDKPGRTIGNNPEENIESTANSDEEEENIESTADSDEANLPTPEASDDIAAALNLPPSGGARAPVCPDCGGRHSPSPDGSASSGELDLASIMPVLAALGLGSDRNRAGETSGSPAARILVGIGPHHSIGPHYSIIAVGLSTTDKKGAGKKKNEQPPPTCAQEARVSDPNRPDKGPDRDGEGDDGDGLRNFCTLL